MKKIASLLLLGLFMACNPSPNDGDDQNEKTEAKFPTQELIEFELNNKVVYGVLIKDYSDKAANRAYELQLNVADQVWIDSLFLDLPGGDTVQGEVIFMEAEVNDMGGATTQLKTLSIE
jgi:hypothetical protein